MNIEQVKAAWYECILRYLKGEQLAFEDPDKFEDYLYLFNELCRRMSYLKDKYLILTGTDIPDDNYFNGF